MSQRGDQRIRAFLSSLVDGHAPDVGSALSQVRLAGDARRRRSSITRTVLGGAFAFTFFAAVFLAGFQWGRVSREAQLPSAGGNAGAAEAPEAMVDKWGGTLAWGPSDGGTSLNLTGSAGTTSLTLPEALSPGSPIALSPLGPAGGVLSYGGQGPVITFPGGTSTAAPGTSGTANFSWDPAGKRFAFEACASQGACDVQISSPPSADATSLVTSLGEGVAWSPDGVSVAYVAPGDSLAVADVASGSSRSLVSAAQVVQSSPRLSNLPHATEHLLFPHWSPSGSFIAVTVELDSVYAPAVIGVDGKVLAVGETTTFGLPNLAWRAGTDELYYAEGPVEGGFPPDVVSTLWLLRGPDWVSTQVLALPGEPIRGVFSSPDGSAILFQTLNSTRSQQNLGVGPPSLWWNVIDVSTKTLVERDDTQSQVFDWR